MTSARSTRRGFFARLAGVCGAAIAAPLAIHPREAPIAKAGERLTFFWAGNGIAHVYGPDGEWLGLGQSAGDWVRLLPDEMSAVPFNHDGHAYVPPLTAADIRQLELGLSAAYVP